MRKKIFLFFIIFFCGLYLSSCSIPGLDLEIEDPKYSYGTNDESEIKSKYTVTFYISKNSKDYFEKQLVAKGGYASAPSVTIDGKKVIEWMNSDGKIYDFSSIVTSDVDLYPFF